MSVELSPASTLGFPRPLTQLVKRTLIVKNPNSESVAFKVKTTAPKQYCVRPNSGRIEPGESVEVSVLLQPMKVDPPPGAKCKDKFLVQSSLIEASMEHLNLAEIWSSIEKEGKERISEQKIRCAYIDAEDEDAVPHSPDETMDRSTLIDGSPNSHANGVSPDATQTMFHQADTTLPTPPPTTKPSASASPSQAVNAASSSAAAAGARTLTPSSAEEKRATVPVPAAQLEALGGPTSSTFKSISTPTVSSPKTDGLPVSEVDKLKDEIRQLKVKLADVPTAVAGLRQRGGGVKEELKGELQAQAQVVHQGGVPIEVVAALCVGVFVMTYIFF